VPFTKLPEISIFVGEQFWGRAARASRLERVRTPVKFVPTFSPPPILEFARTGQEKPLTAKALRTAAKNAKKIKFSFSSFAFFAVEDFF